jgi:hypothetical protein
MEQGTDGLTVVALEFGFCHTGLLKIELTAHDLVLGREM